MAFTIESDSKKQVVEVKVSGLLNQKIRKEILLTVAGQLRINNFSKVIIDVTASVFDPDETMIGAWDLANYIRDIGVNPKVRWAFIYKDGESHRKYFEKVAEKEGLSIRYFKNRNNALEWLAISSP